MHHFSKSFMFLLLIFGRTLLVFFFMQASAMEEEKGPSSMAVGSLSSHVYDQLEPLYKAETNFLHDFLSEMNKLESPKFSG